MDSSMDWLKENTIIHCVNNQKLVCHPLSSKWWGIHVVGLDSPGQTVGQRCPGTVNRQKGHMVPFLSCSRISQQVEKSYFKSNYAYFLDCKTDQSSSYYGLQWSVIFVETIFELFQNDIPGKTNADSLVSETYSTFTTHLLFSEVFSSLFSVSGTSSLLYAFLLLLPSPQQVLMYPKQSLPVGQYMSTLQLLWGPAVHL